MPLRPLIAGLLPLLLWLSPAPAAEPLRLSAVTPAPAEAGVMVLDNVAADLRERLEAAPTDLQAGSIRLHSPQWLATFYQRRGYRPVWLNDQGRPNLLSRELPALVAGAVADGLDPADYHHDVLVRNLRSLRIAYAPTLRQSANAELLLSDAFLTLGTHLLAGRLEPGTAAGRWSLEPRQRDLAEVLEQAVRRQDLSGTLAGMLSPDPEYARLRRTLAEYHALAAAGGWPRVDSGGKLELGAQGPRVSQLQARLQRSGDLTRSLPVAEPVRFDLGLEDAVRRFQARHGLTVDGIVGPLTLAALNVPVEDRIRQLRVNLERWRWLPEDLGERYIMVNIAGYRMQVIENGREVLRSKVIVGRDSRPTPVFSDQMSYLVFSPYWHVPRSIAVQDKLPLLKRNPQALSGEGIRLFNDGREVNPSSVDWSTVSARSFPYTLRQDPGPRNALGGIKFMFPNQHSVYIHDTPTQSLFDRERRAFSSGCVRTDAPIELAEYLLRDKPDWDRERIIAASRRGRSQRVDLARPIPVHLLYWTAWTEADGTVHFRDDIYDLDTSLVQALQSAG